MYKKGHTHSEATKQAISDGRRAWIADKRTRQTKKECRDCHIIKPIDQFRHYRDKSRPTGRIQSFCLDCMNTRWASWHNSKSQTYKRDRRLKIEHGITQAEYQDMHEKQEGLCAICRTPEKMNRLLCVDHDHTTGKLRGLLCNRCNVSIGQFEDSSELLQNAINYLASYGSQGY